MAHFLNMQLHAADPEHAAAVANLVQDALDSEDSGSVIESVGLSTPHVMGTEGMTECGHHFEVVEKDDKQIVRCEHCGMGV